MNPREAVIIAIKVELKAFQEAPDKVSRRHRISAMHGVASNFF